jgi:uncharacterized phosphosugar-binding protein
MTVDDRLPVGDQLPAAIAAYFSALQSRLAGLARDEADALVRAADICAHALAARKVIHLYDTGHIISHEMITRTGGPVAYTPLSFRGVLENHNLYRSAQTDGKSPNGDALASERALLDWVFSQRTLHSGDVLIIGSVSGTGMRLVELTTKAQEQGLTVIALTAPSFSRRLPPRHPSGKRLFEVADLVLDNHAEYGDAFLEIENFDNKVCPFSGIAATVLMWALTAGIIERLVQRGIQPSVYTSVNLPGGPEAVERVETNYKRSGY